MSPVAEQWLFILLFILIASLNNSKFVHPEKLGLNLKGSPGTYFSASCFERFEKSDHIVGLTGFGLCSPYKIFFLDLDE